MTGKLANLSIETAQPLSSSKQSATPLDTSLEQDKLGVRIIKSQLNSVKAQSARSKSIEPSSKQKFKF